MSIILVSVVSSFVGSNNSGDFLCLLDGATLRPLKSYGKARYPTANAVVLDKGENIAETMASAGVKCIAYTTPSQYANNAFDNESEVKAMLALCGVKAATVKAATVKAATPAQVVCEDVDISEVPTILADSLSDYQKKAISFKEFRGVCLSEGMPTHLSAPNPVLKWAATQLENVTPSQAAPATMSLAEMQAMMMQMMQMMQK